MRRAVLIFLLATLGCGAPPASDAPDAEAAAPTEPPVLEAVEPPASVIAEEVEVATPVEVAPPTAGEMISIPAGVLSVGSAPGTSWRRARDEADLVPVDLEAFRIDRLPYPNDPARPPSTRVTRERAEALCADEGKRLCTELEWERACKGNEDNRRFPTGPALDLTSCEADPTACASPEGVLQMGVLVGEWTASPGSRGLDASTRIFRGAAPDPEQLQRHRCAARRAATETTASPNLGFRCCAGPGSDAEYPREREVARFHALSEDVDRLRAVLASVPELAAWAEDFTPETPETMMRAVEAGDGVEGLHGWELAGGALRWSPGPGELVWVLTGRSGNDSLLAVLYRNHDGTFRHASSFVLRDEDKPIAVAFTPPSRNELLWSSCWGCLGEGGAVIVREDGTLAVQHR